MKITDVEAIVLRRHDPVRDISDGTQDTLVVRIHTDAGLVGIGEVDSAPEVVKAAIEAPKSHLTCA
ncbi:MAG: mandelate racemase/muconate lactonizing enzyme family protein, partial [Solirubrobacterales bacterium]